MKFLREIKSVFAVMLLSSTLVFGISPVVADNKKGMQVPDEAASLKELLAVVDKTHQGRILEVEIEKEDVDGNEIWVYEVKLLTRKGVVHELEYNAMTLELLKAD